MSKVVFRASNFYKFYAKGEEYIVSPVEDKEVMLNKSIIDDRDCDLDRVYDILKYEGDTTEDVKVRFFFKRLEGNKVVGNITPHALRKVSEEEKVEHILGLIDKYKPDTQQQALNHILYIVKDLILDREVEVDDN